MELEALSAHSGRGPMKTLRFLKFPEVCKTNRRSAQSVPWFKQSKQASYAVKQTVNLQKFLSGWLIDWFSTGSDQNVGSIWYGERSNQTYESDRKVSNTSSQAGGFFHTINMYFFKILNNVKYFIPKKSKIMVEIISPVFVVIETLASGKPFMMSAQWFKICSRNKIHQNTYHWSFATQPSKILE